MMHKGKQVAAVGQVRTSILKNFEIKSKIFYADLDWDLLLKFTSHNIVFEEMSKFPRVKRDLSLVLDKKILFSEIEAISKETEPELIKEIRIFDVYEGNRIESDKKAYAISFTLQDKEKTLTDKIIDKTMSKLMKAFENKTGALIRQ
jgi:phenylalanyl-tRNA synthetase beta chain